MKDQKDQELDHLLRMAADIERNLAHYADAEARIADHLRRFWAPVMRQRLQQHAQDGGDGLSDRLRSVLERIAT